LRPACSIFKMIYPMYLWGIITCGKSFLVSSDISAIQGRWVPHRILCRKKNALIYKNIPVDQADPVIFFSHHWNSIWYLFSFLICLNSAVIVKRWLETGKN
jgi:hypothetical protein